MSASEGVLSSRVGSPVGRPERSLASTAFWARVSLMSLVKRRHQIGGKIATITAPRTSRNLSKIKSAMDAL